MIVLRVLLFFAGAALVALAVRSVIRTFLVPRALQAYLSRAVFVRTSACGPRGFR